MMSYGPLAALHRLYRPALMTLFVLAAGCHFDSEPQMLAPRSAPIVIAHRGLSGEYPQHTLEGYRAAIAAGADYIEPDLVMTKDGTLVARHDAYLSTTTDVSARPEFAKHRRFHPTFDKEDWWVEDFTLAELKTLRARQDFPGRSLEHDDLYVIPTFAEVVTLVQTEGQRLGKPIGLYPETKHPGHFRSIGLDLVPPLLAVLGQAGLNQEGTPVFIQSFDPCVFAGIRAGSPLPLVLLLAPNDEGRLNARFEDYLGLINGIGPNKDLLLDKEGNSTGLLERAQAQGLLVHPWTFRDDQLPEGQADPAEEYRRYLQLGVDGVFTDHTGTAVAARDDFLMSR